MSENQASSRGRHSLPVFVFPNSLTFYVRDISTHKQLLTIYNPYEFALSFQVLSTAPEKYSVGNPSGILKPGCCVDIVVKQLKLDQTFIGKTDKFRVEVHEQGQRDVSGRKDVPATLLEALGTDEQFHSRNSSEFCRVSGLTETPSEQHRFTSGRHRSSISSHNRHSLSPSYGTSLLAVLVAVVCIASLSLPTQDENSSEGSMVPVYLHLTVPQKLVAAYVLGEFTCHPVHYESKERQEYVNDTISKMIRKFYSSGCRSF